MQMTLKLNAYKICGIWQTFLSLKEILSLFFRFFGDVMILNDTNSLIVPFAVVL